MVRHVVILAPHCGDEAAFAGELLHKYTNRIGRRLYDVTVVFTTDSSGGEWNRSNRPKFAQDLRAHSKRVLDRHGVRTFCFDKIKDGPTEPLLKEERIYAALKSKDIIDDKTILLSISSGNSVDNEATYRVASRIANEYKIDLHVYWGLNNLGRPYDRPGFGEQESPAPRKATEFKISVIDEYMRFFHARYTDLTPAVLKTQRGRHDLVSTVKAK